ncbi:MAG: hypothetical protein M3277_11720 [Actinomycetota bacterium]|nr:hypothetical protein [Actinomycetota bacterium]
MKRLLVLMMVTGLVFGSIAAAEAGKRKAKPVLTTLFLHGDTLLGENDSMTLVNDVFLKMDAKEPTGSEPKSRFIMNYGVGPNTQCAGNNLFPVWTGPLTGQVQGDVKVTLHTIGTPGPVVLRIWPDIAGQACDSELTGAKAYVEPAGEITVDLPPGHGEIEAVFKDVNFAAQGILMFQLSPAVAVDLPSPAGAILNPFVSRVLYDSTDFVSSLEFSCIPSSGKACTP